MLDIKLDMSQLKHKSNIFGGIVIIATFIFTFSANGVPLGVMSPEEDLTFQVYNSRLNVKRKISTEVIYNLIFKIDCLEFYFMPRTNSKIE